MMIDNRRRKRVKRCSGANLLLAIRLHIHARARATAFSHLILRSIAVKGKWNHACMQKETMRWCAYMWKRWNVNRIEQPVQLLFFLLHCCLLSTHTSVYLHTLTMQAIVVIYRCPNLFFFSYSLSVIYIWVCVYIYPLLYFDLIKSVSLRGLPSFSSVTFIGSIVRFYLHTHMHIAHRHL
jgi:hypothetical protein